jgi:L-ornithine N5-oxygenase
MKDLATLRNPQSPITFLSYLHSQDRLLSFINRGQTIPSRREFADYLAWAAAYVQEQGIKVQFGYEVIGIQAASAGTIEIHSKNMQTGDVAVHYARKASGPFGLSRTNQFIHF